MSDDERDRLTTLNSDSPRFISAVSDLYQAPEIFFRENFSGVFTELADAFARLLDHPSQPGMATVEEKLTYVYDRFLPLLKRKLRQEVITHHIADLIGLSQEATQLLIARDVNEIVHDLSTQGFSVAYFANASWTGPAGHRRG